MTSWSPGSAEFIAKRKQVGNDYFTALKRQAEDVEYLPPAVVTTLLSNEAQFLTAMGKQMTFSFLCRSKTCLFYGNNHQWIQKDDGEGNTNHKFRCPMCGKRFHPGSTKGYKQGAVAANFVLAYQDAKGTRWALPCYWPPKVQMQYLQRQIEITAEESLQTIKQKYPGRLTGIDVYGNSQQILQAYLASQFSATHMNQHYMSAERIAWFRSSVPKWNKGESFERVSRDGFQGNNLCLGSQVDLNAITTEQWPDTIAMMANEMARVRHQLSLSDKDLKISSCRTSVRADGQGGSDRDESRYVLTNNCRGAFTCISLCTSCA